MSANPELAIFVVSVGLLGVPIGLLIASRSDTRALGAPTSKSYRDQRKRWNQKSKPVAVASLFVLVLVAVVSGLLAFK